MFNSTKTNNNYVNKHNCNRRLLIIMSGTSNVCGRPAVRASFTLWDIPVTLCHAPQIVDNGSMNVGKNMFLEPVSHAEFIFDVIFPQIGL